MEIPDTRERVQQAVPGAPILIKPVDAQALTRTLSQNPGLDALNRALDCE
jgi:hypothetical protein